MEGIAAYADEGSNPSVNDEGSDQEEVDRADVMDAVDDNAEDGYRGKDLVHADYSYEQKEQEDDSQEPSRQQTSEFDTYEEEEEEGELSPSVKKDSEVASSQEEGNNEDSNLDASDKNGLEEEEEEEEEGERVLPQEVTTPFSLASFLSNMAPEITDEAPSREQEKDRDLEFAYVNGTYVRVAKYKVDMEDLDRRLDDLRQQRREERGLLRMYGLDESEDQGGGGGGRGGRNDDSRGSRDGRDKNRDTEDSRRRSRSRSRDRDRDRRRSRSRERRRSRSRDRRRSRSRDRSSRRDRESPDRSRGRDDKDRFGRDKDRFGRDRDDKDRFGREKDRFGRDKDRFGRDRQEHSRDRDREDRKDEREHGRSKSPRSDRRDTNNRDRPSGGRGQEGNSQFRDEEKQRHDSQELSMYGDQRGNGRQESSFSGGQDFYPSQQPPPPVPVPPPETFPHNQFQGPQGGAFSQPPPQLDPFSTSVPPPQPWMGAGFQPQQGPPPPQQPPPHLLGSAGYTQPPPPLPAGLGAVNNGDINSLQKNLSMLTGASEVNTGSPAMSGSAGYGGVAQEPSQPPMGYSGYGRDTGFSDSVVDDDPMDLDLPSTEESDDYQNRVVEEVKNAIRPFFSNGQISKDDYKEILKKCVPKVANSGEINRKKISNLVGAYVKKMKGQGRPK